MKFTIQEILTQERLTELAHEAMEAYQIIMERFQNSFSLGEPKLKCYQSYSGDIYREATIDITDNTWTYYDEYDKKRIKVLLTPDGILTMFVSQLAHCGFEMPELKRPLMGTCPYSSEPKKLDYDFGLTPEEEELCHAASDFREFVLNCKSELEEKEAAEEQDSTEEDSW